MPMAILAGNRYGLPAEVQARPNLRYSGEETETVEEGDLVVETMVGDDPLKIEGVSL